jgi:hypothetical protein
MMDNMPFYQSRYSMIMIDKAIANQSSAAKIFGCRWKDTALHPFKFASGEGAQCGEDAGKGMLEARRTYYLHPLGRCPDQERQRRIGKPAQTQGSKGHQRCGVSV